MLRGQLPTGPCGHPNNERHVELPAGHVEQRGGSIHQLIERQQAEVDCHDFDDRTEPSECGTDAGADEPRL